MKNNSLATQTELYISLDFPPKEKYLNGYNKVKEYLKAGIEGFKEVHIFYQEVNLGPIENSLFLQQEIFKQYERYIYTEDDNIFSPNFLEYMNQCLDKYEEDNSIFAIGGYSYPIEWAENKNSLIAQSLFPAWGYGIWKKEYDEEKAFTRQDVIKYIRNINNAIYLNKMSRRMFNHAVHIARGKHYLALDVNGNLQQIDAVMALYMIINKKKMIIPNLSKVRNMGHDGSGLNCKKSSKTGNTFDSYNFNKQEYDKNNDFFIENSELINESRVHIKKLKQYFHVSHTNMIKTWILWLFYVFLSKEKTEKL